MLHPETVTKSNVEIYSRKQHYFVSSKCMLSSFCDQSSVGHSDVPYITLESSAQKPVLSLCLFTKCYPISYCPVEISDFHSTNQEKGILIHKEQLIIHKWLVSSIVNLYRLDGHHSSIKVRRGTAKQLAPRHKCQCLSPI